MSAEITTAMVEQYKSNVSFLSQQKGSRLRGSVRTESINGENVYFEQIGATAAQKKTSRHMDTPQIDTPHHRRKISVDDYVWADFIDKEDLIRTLIDPTSPYAVNAVNAFGRSMDDVIIAAASGTSYAGKTGGTAMSLGASQQVGSSASNEGMTLAKLIEAKGIFWTNDIDEDIPLHIAVSSQQLQDMLAIEKLTSSDYTSIQALIKGEINQFMGFTFHRTQRLSISSDDVRTCLAWAQDGILLGIGADIHTNITERADKNYLTQVWCAMTIGATRMEEKKVVEIYCDENPD